MIAIYYLNWNHVSKDDDDMIDIDYNEVFE